MSKIIKNIILILIGFLLITAVFAAFSSDNKVKDVPISDIVNLVDQGKVEKLTISGDTVTAKIKDSQELEQAKRDPNQSIYEVLKDSGVNQDQIKSLTVEQKNGSVVGNLASAVLPFLVPFILISLFIYFLMRQVQGTKTEPCLSDKAQCA
jgi:ATP-dependent Zn protease